MQQQIPQQEQYGNQQQISQPMMFCPFQYVFETPMLVQQEEQAQQPQPYLINVQNPPPWIQNRPQNQIVYVQQMPNNIQSFIHPNMIQNPIYQQQINYQIPQMLMPQEVRPVMQIPNLPHYNTVQNPAQQTEQTSEKMPLLTQILNHKINNVQINPNVRPVMQNQQVQTDISSPNNRGKPKNGPRPQVITINPMQQRPFAPPQKQDVIINITRPVQPNIRQEIPSHIRNKIPNSISVKTVYRPILPRPLMRPYDIQTQNFYYPNINNYVTPETAIRNALPEPDNVVMPQKIIQNDKFVDVSLKKFKIDEQQTINIGVNEDRGKFDPNINVNQRINASVSSETQTEEKLIRNTVFVQARGRVLNEKETFKRTLDDRIQENKGKSIQPLAERPKKYIKIEMQQSIQMPNAKPIVANVAANVNTLSNPIPAAAPQIKNPEAKSPNTKTDVNLDTNKFKIPELDNLKTKLTSFENKKERTEDPVGNVKDSKEVSDQVSKESKVSKDIKGKDPKMKEDKIVVLTHVLDGHIIQESNVAFPIQKPSKEWEIEKVKNVSPKGSKKCKNIKNEVIPLLPLSYQHLTKNMESEEEMEFAVDVEDSPFANIQKSVVRTWTTDQLADHFSKHSWKETASKILDQEIDGESILLVNKDQLIIIGVCEKHADVISTFVGKN